MELIKLVFVCKSFQRIGMKKNSNNIIACIKTKELENLPTVSLISLLLKLLGVLVSK